MSEFSIDYDLGHNGWAGFRMQAGERAIDVGAFGYCSDALGDLVRAALMVATSGDGAEARFDGEPFEWRLVLDQGWPSETYPAVLRLRVLTFDDFHSFLPEAEGTCVFEARVDADRFATAVLGAVRRIWDEHGASGYNERWISRERFPLRGMKALEAALAWADPPSYDEEHPDEPEA